MARNDFGNSTDQLPKVMEAKTKLHQIRHPRSAEILSEFFPIDLLLQAFVHRNE